MEEELYKRIYNEINECNNLYSSISLVEKCKNDSFLNYTSFDLEKYNKILIHKNDLFDVYIICWSPGQHSNFHDHPIGGCIMKILEGVLVEELINNNLITYKSFKKDDVNFIIGNNFHKITNNTKYNAISLHFYSLPGYKVNIL